MKLKKVLVAVVTAVTVFGFSGFSNPVAAEPGFADSHLTPFHIPLNSSWQTYLGANDNDWYAVKNETSEMMYIAFTVYPSSSSTLNVDFQYMFRDANGSYTPAFYLHDAGPGKAEGLQRVAINPGATFLWNVIPHNSGTDINELYTTSVHETTPPPFDVNQ
ncbi:hypothetical protein [Paenibacillus agilis]|uniref:Uncharacterized protein n=1 Tax=Paenibacillus agilis TaxID=3020863 RepID=A0A559IZM7_9BACL|nr:hypothetical protein [Paenibacillus agilis]TVX93081.1 hypothetical protein FPZ44_08415 [Paenibacillus agilis]